MLTLYRCVWNTVVDLSNATRKGLITLELVGGASEQVGGAAWPVGGAIASTLTTARDLEFSRTLAVFRSHISAGDSSAWTPVIHRRTKSLLTDCYIALRIPSVTASLPLFHFSRQMKSNTCTKLVNTDSNCMFFQYMALKLFESWSQPTVHKRNSRRQICNKRCQLSAFSRTFPDHFRIPGRSRIVQVKW